MIRLAASDMFTPDKLADGAASLLSAVNIVFRTRGAAGCRLDSVTLTEASEEGKQILTITAVPGDKPATMDDMRGLWSAGKQGKRDAPY